MRVLFLTHRLPYAPNRGDRIRAYYLLQEMSRFARVTLLSFLHDDDEAARTGEVPFAERVVGVRMPRTRNLIRGLASLPSRRPLTHALLAAPDARSALRGLVQSAAPDIVVAYCSSMARLALEEPLDTTPFVLDMVDVDSLKWKQMAMGSGPLHRWIYNREAATLSAFETAAVMRAQATLVVNERERDALVRIAPNARITVVPNGIDVAAFTPPATPGQSDVVMFCGVMSYSPNEEGVQWFVREVWPRVRQARPSARFLVVGAGPTRALRKLAEEDHSIEVVGAVPAVQPYLWQSALSVAPLQLARGLQNKVLEALAAGLPVVVTSAVFEGLPEDARPGCIVAGEAAEFAEAVVGLLAQAPEARRRHAAAARLEGLTWAARLGPVRGILDESIARSGALRSTVTQSLSE